MSDDIYIDFLEKCVGKSSTEFTTAALTGEEIVEAIWLLNEAFKSRYHMIASLSYESKYEKQADEAIISYALKKDNWETLSGEVLRILLERVHQAIIYFQLNAKEPFVPIPDDLHPDHYLAAVMLFLLHQWTLPFPITHQSTFDIPEHAIQGDLKRH